MRLFIEVLAYSSGLLDLRSEGLAAVAYDRDVAADLFCYGALLFGGTGDLQVHVADHRDCSTNPGQTGGG
ncbi:hypothetical protein D3C78_1930720 [compost metagenome]